ITQGSGGGFLAWIIGENSKLVIGNDLIFDTCSGYNGGGLSAIILNGAQLIFEGDCKFDNCSSLFSGGGIYAQCNNEGSLIQYLGELSFDNCSSLWSGGGASLGSGDKASIELNKVTCVDCKSGQGAGLNVQPSLDTHFTISGKASFTRCESTGSGGGICFNIQGENIEIQLTGEMEFIDCIGIYGGGISIGSIYKIILVISSLCTFKNCTGSQGGGMYMPLSDIETEIQITGLLSFDNCSSNQGGGLYLSTSGSSLSFTNAIQFKNCSSQYSGGGLWASCSNEGTIQFIGGMNFENCSTNQQGGAIYARMQSGSQLTIDGQCKFTECTTQVYGGGGGGIYAYIIGAGSKLIIGDGAI
ncbi:MAG: hypothetical protein EZS28_050079, partial [Streblomastix strix]